MDARRFLLCCIVLLASTGCRTDPAISLLEQENTMLEDKIFEQQYQLQQCCEALDSCRRENAALRRRLGAGEADQPETYEPTRATPGSEAEISVPDLPTVEMPAEPIPEGQIPDRLRAFDATEGAQARPSTDVESAPRFLPAPSGLEEEAGPAERLASSTRVAKIALNRFLTGGLNIDRRLGDEGISMLIQPLDEHGELVPAAAPISVAVLDPALSGEAARVARWDFTADEVVERLRDTGLGKGIYLEMYWPAQPPAHSQLLLYVRYTTEDGRVLQTDTDVRVEVLGDGTDIRPPVLPGPEQQSGNRAGAWQSKPRRASQPAEREPVQPAVHLAEPESEAAEPAEASAASPEPQPARPAWSPDRDSVAESLE
jgi:hypothetical protein